MSVLCIVNSPSFTFVVCCLQPVRNHFLLDGSVTRVPTVRESQGILSESGKVRENREGQSKVREF